MPHRCVKCGTVYFDKAPELIQGCSCGARLFLFVRDLQELEKVGDIRWLIDELKPYTRDYDRPVTLEVENVRMLQRGVFELNIPSLMRRDPLVVKDMHGVYYIKLPEKPSSILATPKEEK